MTESQDIFDAAVHYDVLKIKGFLDAGTDINSLNSKGQTPIAAMFEQYYWSMDSCYDPELFLPFEYRKTNIAYYTRLMMDWGADLNRFEIVDGEGGNPLYYAVMFQDAYMVCLLLHYGANPNFRYYWDESVGTYFALDNISAEIQILSMETTGLLGMEHSVKNLKRLCDIQSALLEHGAKYYTEEYGKKVIESQKSGKIWRPVAFEYVLSGTGWAHCRLKIGENEQKFRISFCMHDDINRLLRTLVGLIYGNRWNIGQDDAFCPYEDCNFVWDEEGDILKWNLTCEGLDLHIRIDRSFTDSEGLSPEIIFDEHCHREMFIARVVEACETLLKKHGMIGYHSQFGKNPFDINNYLVLKAYLLGVNFKLEYPYNDRKTNFQDEIMLLGMGW